MTAAELIEKLKQVPPETPVLTYDQEWGYCNTAPENTRVEKAVEFTKHENDTSIFLSIDEYKSSKEYYTETNKLPYKESDVIIIQ